MTNENSDANTQGEIGKAFTALRAARALGELAMYDDAASRLYFATFHIVSAALMRIGVQAHTQAGVSSLLGQHLIRPGLLPNSVGRDFAILLGLRGQADYNRHFQLDQPGFDQELLRAEAVFAHCAQFLKSRGAQLPE